MERKCSTGLTARTFYERIYHCYYFKAKNSYTKGVNAIFKKVLKKVKGSILKTFSEVFSGRVYTGLNAIEYSDKEAFRVTCLRCAINLDKFLSRFKITNLMEEYCHKWKVKGYIHGLVKFKNKTYILALSFDDIKITQKDIDFFCLNGYLYNAANHTNYDLLVMNVPQEQFYIVPFLDKDYTIERGYLSFSTKIRKRGEHCTNCVHPCKPQYINGLERMELTMLELVTKGGKKIGELSDVVGGQDKLIVQGKNIDLEDVYGSEKLTREFNTQAKELHDDADENADSAGTTK